MRLQVHFFLGAVVLLGVDCFARGQDKSNDTSSKSDQNIARIQQFLSEASIDTKGWPKEMSLTELLKTLEAGLPRNKKITLRIDEKAFGKNLPRIASATMYFT